MRDARCEPVPLARGRRATTLVELLVTIGVIGLLAALLLPAAIAAREASRAAQCRNRLRQVGLALTGHAAAEGALPVGCVDCSLPPPVRPPRLTSWLVHVLPRLGEQPLADRFAIESPVYREPNLPLSRVVLPELLCPSAEGPEAPTRATAGAFTDYAGVYGVEGKAGGEEIPLRWLGALVYERAVRLGEVTDGLSHTAAAAETLLRREPLECEWANGHNLFAHEWGARVNEPTSLGNGLGSAHPGGALVATLDGAVRWLADDADPAAVAALLTRAEEDLP